jgi:hypothetical protein
MTAQDRIPERLGPYQLVARLGEGGMGVVYLARDPAQGTVAVKALRSTVAVDPTARRRLAREVETMRRVHSPFVAEVIDADVTGDPPYIVTRHVPGRTLDDVVASSGPLAGLALARLARGLAAALTAVHAAGVVHRDLKPGNVMLVNGEPVVIDFGIAQVPESTRITLTGMFMGTPGYLAPEVIEGKQGGPAADVHSWGATVAFAATGRPPFGTGSFETVFYRIVQGQPDLDTVPAPLAALVAWALARDPASRPPAAELAARAAALDPAALVPSAPTRAASAVAGPAAAGRTVVDSPAAAVPPRRGRAAARTAPPLPRSATRPLAAGPAGPAAAPGAAWQGAAGAGAAGLGAGGQGAGGGSRRAAGPAAPPGSASDFRDVLPPVSYPPPAAQQQARRTGAAPQPGPAVGPEARSVWSPLVIGVIAMLISVSILLPLAGTAAAVIALIALRAADHTGNRLAKRRSRQGRRRGDFVLAGAYFPVALCRSAVRFVLLSPLGLLSAGLVAAITIITVTLHPLPLAVGYGAGTLVAFFGLGPGSSGCRKPLARFFGAAARTPARTVTAFIVVCVLAIAAIAAAGSQPPVYWPAGNLSMQLAHMPGLHGVITDIRLTIVRLGSMIGL